MYRNFIKRFLDFVLALTMLFILLLPMLIFSIIISKQSKGGALFKQERIGENGKVFIMYKFRTMYFNTEKTGSGVYSRKDDERVTPFGKFLRKYSLDELPQLINVLKGEMSFVGPRPPMTYHPWTFDKYSQEQRRMFNVRPGLTGWAQVNGRKNVEWNRRINLNLWYVDNLSFSLDVKIIFKTIAVVFKKDDNFNTGETVVKE